MLPNAGQYPGDYRSTAEEEKEMTQPAGGAYVAPAAGATYAHP